MIWTIAKKELRGYFNSAVALIFLGAFLAGVLYTFFWYEKFFARGLADLRPLFEWMPKLLIILVSALAMRLWAEERNAGTLEILLTLPVQRWRLVTGKFLAGMMLIAIALALTLGIPFTVAHMGNLDTGPVIGGYLAALLLSAAYLVIGMCVSAATNIQIVAFVGTFLLCGATYLIGSFGEVGRLLGTGARFESVARGVLDLRDLAYYGGIFAIGFAVNIALLGRVSWGKSPRVRKRRFDMLLGVGLIAANAVALDFWLAPVGRARIDLTEDRAYSLSSTTKQIVSGLEEKLLIRGYFSEKTHPELEPLIPQIRDLLDEYRVAGGGHVQVEMVDPTDDDDAKRDAKTRFDISPQPMGFSTSSERSVVNAYFAIAIQYGNQREVLGLMDLIQVRQLDLNKIDISLRNVEYQITKAIKKSAAGFSSLDSLYAATAGKIQLTTYLTPDTLPENLRDGPAMLKRITDDLAKESNGKVAISTVIPKSETEIRDIVKATKVSLFQDSATAKVFLFAVVLEMNGHPPVPIQLPEGLGDAGIKTAIVETIKRGAPGFAKVVGIWMPTAGTVPDGMGAAAPQPPQAFQRLRRSLAGDYEVREVQLGGRIADDVDVLVLCGPADLDAKSAESIDQFVMRGRSLVVLDGRFRLAPSQNGIAIEKVTTGLESMLDAWGIKVDEQMVLDTKSDTFPIPRARDVGGGNIVQEIQQLPYPYFVRVAGRQLSSSIITGGVPGSIVHFGSPVEAKEKVGDDLHVVDEILESSDASWLSNSLGVDPDPDQGVPQPPDESRASHPLAVAVTGGFASSIKKPADPKTRLLTHTTQDARIVVFGSSVFASDALMAHAEQMEQDLALANLSLVHNAVDWAFAETDLLAIRAHNAEAHSLTLDPEKRDTWRVINAIIALILLAGVIGFAWFRRRSVKPVLPLKGAV